MEMKVKVTQACLTLCDPMDYTLNGILQAFPFSRGSSQPRDWTQVSSIAGRFFTSWAIKRDEQKAIFMDLEVYFENSTPYDNRRELMSVVVVLIQYLSCVWLFATPQTTTCQDPLSMGSPRQECWHGLPFASPGDLPNPGIEPMSSEL